MLKATKYAIFIRVNPLVPRRSKTTGNFKNSPKFEFFTKFGISFADIQLNILPSNTNWFQGGSPCLGQCRACNNGKTRKNHNEN